MSVLGPWRWLVTCPEHRRVALLRLWAVLLEALVRSMPVRNDPRLHVSDLLHETESRPISPEVARLLLDGLWKHAKWHAVMKETGIVLAQETEIIGGGLVGTPDYVTQMVSRMIVDVKSVGSGNFARIREGVPLPHHRDQVIAYLDLDPQAEFGVILYENRDDLDLALCCVERDPERAGKIRARRAAPRAAIGSGVVPTETISDGGDGGEGFQARGPALEPGGVGE